jgi:hypothetical protein
MWEDREFEVSLGYIGRHYLKNNKRGWVGERGWKE